MQQEGHRYLGIKLFYNESCLQKALFIFYNKQ